LVPVNDTIDCSARIALAAAGGLPSRDLRRGEALEKSRDARSFCERHTRALHGGVLVYPPVSISRYIRSRALSLMHERRGAVPDAPRIDMARRGSATSSRDKSPSFVERAMSSCDRKQTPTPR
jgi:hypothetical protein